MELAHITRVHTHSLIMPNTRVPQPYKNYSNIDWKEFIQSAVASGNETKYCESMNVTRAVYNRRKAEYKLCNDKSSYTFTKHTNITKRLLSCDSEQNVINQLMLQNITDPLQMKLVLKQLCIDELHSSNTNIRKHNISDNALNRILYRHKLKQHRVKGNQSRHQSINNKTQINNTNINNNVMNHSNFN